MDSVYHSGKNALNSAITQSNNVVLGEKLYQRAISGNLNEPSTQTAGRKAQFWWFAVFPLGSPAREQEGRAVSKILPGNDAVSIG